MLELLNDYRTPLSYPGGKKKLWPIFRSYLPTDVLQLVSPFVGGAAIELACAANGIKVKAFDNFEPLVNFWKQMQLDANVVVDQVRHYFPLDNDYFRYVFKSELIAGCADQDGSIFTDVERAALFFVINKMSFNGFSLARGYNNNNFKKVGYFKRWRNWTNNNITFGHQDCFDTIQQYDGVFMYLDPPYIGNDHYYGANTNPNEQHFDHYKLCSILKQSSSKWILSYGDHTIIRELYCDYKMITPSWNYSSRNWIAQGVDSSELLILNL